MNNITYFEFALVGIIILIQISQTIKTRKKINIYRFIIPQKDFFKIKLFNIPIETLLNNEPKNVLNNLDCYQKTAIEPIEYEDYTVEHLELLTPEEIIEKVENDFSVIIKGTLKSEIINEALSIYHFHSNENNIDESEENEISLINPNDNSNPIFEGLLHSINVYLLRNKGATTDFNLIKDITERNVDTEDEDISQQITTPLYLGLMGTMLGIIFGLINLFIVSGEGTDFEIQGFLIGVAIAMSASFLGLLCTVANSASYKTARKEVEVSKNNFYTFIQTELLPILNQSVSSSVHTLHTNLVRFNDNFTVNINKLTGVLNKNYDAVIAQDNILQSLERIDITEFAKANVKVLKELKTGTEDLHKFNQYLGLLNSTVDGTARLSHSFETLLNRTNNFEGFAQKLDSRIEESNNLVQFLNDHYEVLDERGTLLNDSVKKVDDVLSKSLVELREHTSEKIEAIKDITIKEEDLMTKAFAENKSHFSKLSLLDNLNTSINDIKSNSEKQLNTVNSQIKLLKESIDKTNTSLDKISNQNSDQKVQGITKKIKSFFTSKETKNE